VFGKREYNKPREADLLLKADYVIESRFIIESRFVILKTLENSAKSDLFAGARRPHAPRRGPHEPPPVPKN
jgi:hypothetical protein